MKNGTHDIMVVSGENGYAVSGLPIPDSDRLIVGGTDDPGIFGMEKRRPDVVQMPEKGENASPLLIIPNLKSPNPTLARFSCYSVMS